MSESGAERTEQATPKRQEEARKQGQVPRSAELSMAAVCIAAAAAIYTLGGGAAAKFAELMRGALALRPEQTMGDGVIWPALMDAGFKALIIVLPILGATFCAALAAPLAIGGWNFSAEALMPKFSKLNPAKGLVKVAVVASIGWTLLRGMTPQMLSLSSEPLNSAISHSAAIVGYALMVLCFGLVVIAGVDVPFQLWQHSRDLKMTREEVKEEHKESEGSPETRGRIREAQRALSRGRMMQDVPKADVVITNPTHFAVALRYDDKKMRAPIVVAKGTDLLAARIREIAAEAGVPLVAAPPLARALYSSVALGREVPAALYVAVAQILTYVYQLKAAVERGVKPPPPPVIN